MKVIFSILVILIVCTGQVKDTLSSRSLPATNSALILKDSINTLKKHFRWQQSVNLADSQIYIIKILDLNKRLNKFKN